MHGLELEFSQSFAPINKHAAASYKCCPAIISFIKYAMQFFQLLQHINPCVASTVLSGAKCYAIRRNDGFKYLLEMGVTNPSKSRIEQIVREKKLGEVNALKNFLKDEEATKIKSGNSKKSRAVLFRRSLINKQLRKSFDKRKFKTNLILVRP